MFHSTKPRFKTAVMACVFGAGFGVAVHADDVVSFATGGYARGLHSDKLMHHIDTNGDGMVSKDEWLAFQEKVFAMLDKDHLGNIDAKAFLGPSSPEFVSFATGGYARGLRTKAMMHKIDADGDGRVSHDEFIAYQTKVFEMMDTDAAHKGMIDRKEMFATGGANRH
jgi:hypothetical protein